MHFAQLVDSRPDGDVLSASQTERFDRCKRRWGLEYIAGIRFPPHPSAQLGTDVHAVLEDWLAKGKPPNLKTKQGRIAARMIRNLPPPGTGITERRFYFTTHSGIHWTGFIDWSGIFHDWPTVVDHKTTSNLGYAKTEQELLCDIQALTYTVAGCLGFQVDNLQLLWNYGSTKGQFEDHPVYVRTHLPIVVEQFETVLEPMTHEMVWHRRNRTDPMLLPANPLACEDYGGCPHQHICQITPEQRTEALMNAPAQPTLAARLSNMPTFAPPGGTPSNIGGVPPHVYNQPPQAAPAFAPPQQGYQAQPPQPLPGFASPAPQGYAQPQQPPQAAPGFAAPQQPPQAASAFTPPQAPAQQQMAFNPETGPNAPENGAQVPQQAGEKPKRGRPRKTETAVEQSAQIATVAPPTLSVDQQIYLQGVTSFMQSHKWDGTPEALHWAGSLAVQVFRGAFGG